ncbi:hypothetical protein PX699_02220 [Sphingobium sp. H39-3-25]|uniref:hypothetical protein n=1 Tax=Sphingobium arseniciresistens TaxID=3030834 RepID=UPI0023BA0F3D|nr:hypothetical protein [Sphingobium arseniciresistens]
MQASSAKFHFTLQLEVNCPTTLWHAAAIRCLKQGNISVDELIDLIGPLEDPSLSDCVMAMALPDTIPGCTRLAVELNGA